MQSKSLNQNFHDLLKLLDSIEGKVSNGKYSNESIEMDTGLNGLVSIQ